MTALRCVVPHVWNSIDNRCIDWVSQHSQKINPLADNDNEFAFEVYFRTLNMITEVALVMLPFRVIWRLQLNIRKKATIMVCFATRML